MTTDLMPIDAQVPALAEDRGGITPVAALQHRIEVILDVMANVLEPTKDYGVIPGTDKPSLFKAGAEKLCLTFSLATADPYVDDLSDPDAIRYRVRVPVLAPTGRVMAVGVGEASTDEEKYRWRRPVCDDEFNETPPTLRREKWQKGKGGGAAYKNKQVRTVPADLANTVLKMAHKRAFIHATLLATGASSVFNQDLEHLQSELAESLVEHDAEARAEQSIRPPSRKSAASAATAPSGATTATGLLLQCAKAGPQWLIALKDDARDFTARDDKLGEAGVALLNKPVQLTFVTKQGDRRTFYNVTGLKSGVTAETPATPASSARPLTADRIPFGDEPREPGQEG